MKRFPASSFWLSFLCVVTIYQWPPMFVVRVADVNDDQSPPHSGWTPGAGRGQTGTCTFIATRTGGMRETRRYADIMIRKHSHSGKSLSFSLSLVMSFSSSNLRHSVTTTKTKENITWRVKYLLLIMFSTWRQLNNQHWHDNMFDLIIDRSKCKVMAEKLGIKTDSISLQTFVFSLTGLIFNHRKSTNIRSKFAIKTI